MTLRHHGKNGERAERSGFRVSRHVGTVPCCRVKSFRVVLCCEWLTARWTRRLFWVFVCSEKLLSTTQHEPMRHMSMYHGNFTRCRPTFARVPIACRMELWWVRERIVAERVFELFLTPTFCVQHTARGSTLGERGGKRHSGAYT